MRRLVTRILRSSFFTVTVVFLFAYFVLWACGIQVRTQDVLTTTGASVVVTAVGVGATGTIAYLIARSSKAKATAEEAEVGSQWLDARQHELPEELAAGKGPSIDELAQSAAIPREHQERFGALLREHHEELLQIVETRKEPKDSLRFYQRIQELMLADPELAPFAKAQAQRLEPPQTETEPPPEPKL
ncbi:MAG: DUF3015 family protein [Myxococcaceae bacterium]